MPDPVRAATGTGTQERHVPGPAAVACRSLTRLSTADPAWSRGADQPVVAAAGALSRWPSRSASPPTRPEAGLVPAGHTATRPHTGVRASAKMGGMRELVLLGSTGSIGTQ